EDGIRDFHVTGVQTCALPIFGKTASLEFRLAAEPDAPRATTEMFDFREEGRPPVALERSVIITGDQVTDAQASYDENGRPQVNRSEERRVGEAWRLRLTRREG